MANRSKDWLAQALHDLQHAEHALEDADYDWACFVAQQGAEKALKDLFMALGGEAWGHSILRLLRDLAPHLSVPDELHQAGLI